MVVNNGQLNSRQVPKTAQLVKNKIKQLRNERGITIRELAEITGIERSLISNYENWLRDPNKYVYYVLAQYFNVELWYIEGFERSPLHSDDEHHEQIELYLE